MRPPLQAPSLMEREKDQIKLQQEMPQTAIVVSVGYCDLAKAKRKKDSQQVPNFWFSLCTKN